MTPKIRPSIDPGGRRVRPVEAAAALLASRVLDDADGREDDQADQHAHREEVLEEPQRRAVADPGDGEGLGEQVPVSLDDREQQDDEAPEHEEVGDARKRAPQQLALARTRPAARL